MEIEGRLLGNRYKILNNIGEGGTARVYKGMDTRLNRPVAIKVLYEQFAGDADFLRRFKQEAKAAAKLSHPAIVNVYDEGEEHGIHYIIMEYVDGYTLKDIILRDGRFKPEEAVQVVLQICDALVHAHSQKIIHRDIKPQNIIITFEGRVKVTDFGIARAAADATITYGKSLLGSVYYSSPEQARGSRADEKSDIYSLGIVLYEMLTGAVPFSGESPISIALKHLQEESVPPGKLVPGLPAVLETIVLKAMHKDRDLRYTSAAELRDELEGWLKNQENGNYVSSSFVKRLQSDVLTINRTNNADEEPGKKMRKRGFSLKKVVIYAVLLAVLLAAGFSAYRALIDFLVVPEVSVPDLTGLSLEEAEKELEQLGLNYRVVKETYSDTIPPDHIISQEPPAERSVKQEREIELVLSLGPDYVVVPYLLGSSELEARLRLSDLGLNMEVSYEYSDDVAPDYVIRQDPSQDFRLTKEQTVHVVVSKGKRPFSLRDFKGWLLKDVEEWLSAYGLVTGEIKEEYSDEFAAGEVIAQFPEAHEMVQSGDPVDLVISKGREPGSYTTYNLKVDPRVPIGQVIKVYVEDEEGTKIIFEGPYQGHPLDVIGVGSGQVVLMEWRNQEYHIIDTKYFP